MKYSIPPHSLDTQNTMSQILFFRYDRDVFTTYSQIRLDRKNTYKIGLIISKYLYLFLHLLGRCLICLLDPPSNNEVLYLSNPAIRLAEQL